MKIDGFHASTSGGKKVIAVSLILALVLASISVIAAFAAPTPKSRTAFGNQVSELNFDRAWYNSARLNAANFVRTSDPLRAQQYLSQYAFALQQADATVAGRGTNTTNNNNGSNSSTNNSSNFGSPQANLASWLHMMRGLRDKLTSMGFSANIGSSSVAGAGVPVTGGTTSNNGTSNNGTSSNGTSNSSAATPTATPSTGSSSSSGTGSSSAATPTATPSTGSSSSSGTGSSSAATPTATPSTGSSSSSSSSNSSNSTSSNTNNGAIPNTGANSTLNNTALAKVWGVQFRDLETDRVWLNNFKSHPANLVNSSDPVKTQQWLSQYAFALSQADAIIRSGGTVTTNNNNNAANSGQRTSAQQNLAMWLHMMRDLQMKLTSGTNGVNGTNSGM